MRKPSLRAHTSLRGPRFRDPAIKPIPAWSGENKNFYADFRDWLWAGGYGSSALSIYGVAARLALGLLDKPYWLIDPQSDLDDIRAYINAHYPSDGTRSSYLKGLHKLAEYLCLRNRKKPSPQTLNWAYYCANFPDWLTEMVRAYLTHCRRAWSEEMQHERARDLLSHLTLPLRWMAQQTSLTSLADITPQLWFGYVDQRLADQLKPTTLNDTLSYLHYFLRFQAEQGQPICLRMLRVEPLKAGPRLPRDVPLPHLRKLHAEIDHELSASHAAKRRMAVMDKAWFLLMLHSGLRTLEIRLLKQVDLDLAAGRVYLEQAKGLKDRLVPLSQPTLEAIRAYQAIRGPAQTDHLFLYRHQPLSRSYCGQRLRTYSQRCSLHVTPHQLRHSCATLLLNAGAPVLTVQTILGHKHIDTTLAYARLYDGSVAADYYRAMATIERQLTLAEDSADPLTEPGQLLALVDSLGNGTLNAAQRETVHHLRSAILSLADTAS